jgi:hypothetical protein
MPLTEEQAFKVGFLKHCAEAGLTMEETKQRVKLAIHQLHEKQALLPLIAGLGGGAAWLGDKALSLGSALTPPLISGLTMAGIAAPVLAGGLGGLALAKATGGGKEIVDDAKQDEIIGEYERLADEARRRTRLKQLQSATGRRVIALTPGED